MWVQGDVGQRTCGKQREHSSSVSQNSPSREEDVGWGLGRGSPQGPPVPLESETLPRRWWALGLGPGAAASGPPPHMLHPHPQALGWLQPQPRALLPQAPQLHLLCPRPWDDCSLGPGAAPLGSGVIAASGPPAAASPGPGMIAASGQVLLPRAPQLHLLHPWTLG